MRLLSTGKQYVTVVVSQHRKKRMQYAATALQNYVRGSSTDDAYQKLVMYAFSKRVVKVNII